MNKRPIKAQPTMNLSIVERARLIVSMDTMSKDLHVTLEKRTEAGRLATELRKIQQWRGQQPSQQTKP
jgi:hypothetical protein